MARVVVLLPGPGEPYSDARMLAALADGLAQRGYAVRVLAPDGPSGYVERPAALASALEPTARRPARPAFADLASAFGLRRQLRALEPDLVLAAPGGLSALAAAKLARAATRTVLVAACLERWVQRWRQPRRRLGLPRLSARWIRRFLLANVDAALSAADPGVLAAEALPAGLPVGIAGPPIAPAFWHRPANLGDPRDPELLVVGDLAPRKQHAIAFEALAAAQHSDPAARLTLAGSACSEAMGYLDDLARRQGPGVVLQLGPTDERLVALYARARAVLVPDLEPTGCFVAWEALAQGAPVVARAGSMASRVVADGENGFLADDAQGLIARAIELLRMPSERWLSMQRRARQSVERDDSSRLADELELLLLGRLDEVRRRGASALAAPPALDTRTASLREIERAGTAIALL